MKQEKKFRVFLFRLGLDEVVALQTRGLRGHSRDQIVHNLAMTFGQARKTRVSDPPAPDLLPRSPPNKNSNVVGLRAL